MPEKPGFAKDDLLDDALPLSGLQHLAFCPRQWALIHLEQAWAENRLTAEGRLLHERADLPGQSRRANLRTVRGMQLQSVRLRLSGRADVVEFRPEPFPVEYKRGKRKPTDCDLVQLCAQALCLEEMLRVPVPAGAIFYGEPRRRIDVEFSPAFMPHIKRRLPRRRSTATAAPSSTCACRMAPRAQTWPCAGRQRSCACCGRTRWAEPACANCSTRYTS